MDKKSFIYETEHISNDNNIKTNFTTPIEVTNDNIVNDFINQNISLESLIEKELFKYTL